jgi:hypothetical protein
MSARRYRVSHLFEDDVLQTTFAAAETAASVQRRLPERKPPSKYELYPLPFFDKKQLSTWAVKPTGKYSADYATGRAFAIELLKSCDRTIGWTTLLGQIARDMIEVESVNDRGPGATPRASGIVSGFMRAARRSALHRDERRPSRCLHAKFPTLLDGAPKMTNTESDSTLIALGAELAACDARKELCPDSDEQQGDALYEQHWDLRAKINRIPATTIKGLSVKARSAELAIKWDDDVCCKGDGSFRELCRSIIRDIGSIGAEDDPESRRRALGGP